MRPTTSYYSARRSNLRPFGGKPVGVETVSQPAKRDQVKPVIRFAFYAFVVSLAFETVNIGIPVELTSIFGGTLFLAALAQPGLFFRRPPSAFLFFILYLCQCAIMILLLDDPHRVETTRYLLVFLQLLVMCWISYALMRDARIARTALLMLAASCLILAFMQVTGIATRAPEYMTKSGRMTVFGFHPNNIARIFDLGLITLIGFSYGTEKQGLRPRVIVLLSCALIGIAVVQTGSRGGLLALGTGLLIFALAGKRMGVRIRNAVIVLLALSFFTFVTIESEVTKRRFESAVQKGELARRERIYPTAWQMILEKPVVGWGPVTSSYELGRRLGHPREPSKNSHNLVLEILNVTGLVGAIFFFTGTGLAVLAAWKARHRAHSLLPLALLLTVLAANMSGLWHFNKLHWIVVAYALASLSHPVAVALKRRVARPVIGRPELRASLAG